ncbi:uncharacterized protein MYCGRDRAFT_95620 [Zymoseptoria tritici IPO323]|uniref:Uncharacterized protein n=1 Tax=Zymoseptoria tritici (strain CBS 115943 / IPO323) TaxID=336722 RepID=F9XJF5_ZYMTI|nr:uncharacterized protein MYCGRDRAFT_95620 [Zymoseptoria tritici IPO323]EGP84753.1 hypothetical protein MYCGRDRAFT_95620 [Zymoseptoria tritici IPO323]
MQFRTITIALISVLATMVTADSEPTKANDAHPRCLDEKGQPADDRVVICCSGHRIVGAYCERCPGRTSYAESKRRRREEEERAIGGDVREWIDVFDISQERNGLSRLRRFELEVEESEVEDTGE